VISFFSLTVAAIYMYVFKYLNFDEDKAEAHEIYTEGTMVSLSLFLVIFYF
jgi:hypothetical protein